MANRRSELIAMGVDPRLATRGAAYWTVQVDGKDCRDRQPWGGFTDPDRCGCLGQCEYDRRNSG
jgi:hypothetical protein